MRQIDLTYTIIVPTLARFFLNFIVDSATSNDTDFLAMRAMLVQYADMHTVYTLVSPLGIRQKGREHGAIHYGDGDISGKTDYEIFGNNTIINNNHSEND
eukprot:730854-Ditylum_brightwellii.AAC.1